MIMLKGLPLYLHVFLLVPTSATVIPGVGIMAVPEDK